MDYREECGAAFKELLTACRDADQQETPLEEAKSPDSGSSKGPRPTRRKGEPTATPPRPEEKVKREKEPAPEKEPKPPEPLAVLERRLTGHKGWVPTIAVSPDGTWAASGSYDKTVKVWDLETGTCRATLEGHTADVNSLAITPDGKRIVSGSSDGTIHLWEAANGRLVETRINLC